MASPAKAKTKTKAKTKAKLPAGEPIWLRDPESPRHEVRYKPPSNTIALAGVIVSSVGAPLAGAGFYGRFLHASPPSYAVYLLVGGILAFVAGLFISSQAPSNVRVGDAGLAVESPKGTERLGWFEIEKITVDGPLLGFRSATGKSISISRIAHPAAWARAVIEARSRIPARVEHIKEDVKAPRSDAGERVALPVPQLAGLRCRASDRLIAFEHDARVCGRCGETYHKENVPERCLGCDARLA